MTTTPVPVAPIDRDEDLMGAVGSHPVQGCQVAFDVEGVRGALAVMAVQLVEDGVGQVEAVHGDEPGEEVGLLEPAFQVCGDRRLSRTGCPDEPDEEAFWCVVGRQPLRELVDEVADKGGEFAHPNRGAHGTIISVNYLTEEQMRYLYPL